MAEQNDRKLNQLAKDVPEGLIVDAAWLTRHGYSTALRSYYLDAGWLDQPVRSVYRRPRGSLNWQQVVISLQTLLGRPLIVGGRTALDLQGFAHYLTKRTTEVHLYGDKPPPGWLYKLPLDIRFVMHNDRKLFRSEPISRGLTSQPWGQWDWPLTLSTPERAILELLDELPDRETFHQVDKLMEGLPNLSPRRLQKLLSDCRNVKVKRLFFFFADRHKHAWLKKIDKKTVDLGTGKRMLVKGGKLDRGYQITVPEDLDGVQ